MTTHRLSLALIVLALAGPALAQSANNDTQGTRTRSSQAAHTQAEATEQRRAQQWGLSTNEWDRYKSLKQGIDGYRSKDLDPLTLLGMHARSDAERTRYARKLARLEHQRVERILNFQRAYDQAAQSLYPNEKRIRTDNLSASLSQGQRDAARLGLDSARVAIAVRPDDCQACIETVKRLAAKRRPMDIYVIGAGSDNAIRQWAVKTGLDPKRVRSGEITLNHAPRALASRIDADNLPRVLNR